MYGLLWHVAVLFLRHNKRVKEGWEQRNIPVDWLVQKPFMLDNILVELDKDKPFFGKKTLGNKPYTDELYAGELYGDGPYDVDLWIQAASGGEAYLACEFIRALPEDKRGMSILITTWTRQGMQILEQECEKIVKAWEENTIVEKNIEGTEKLCQIPYIQIRFATLDKINIVRRALNIANPRVCIMLETELWPNFMLACKEKDVPLYVINARMAKTTYELYKIIAKILNFVAPKQVLAMTQDDMVRFSTIFPSALVSYMPNMKFDKAADFVRECLAKFNENENSKNKNEAQADANQNSVERNNLEQNDVEHKHEVSKSDGQKKLQKLLPDKSDIIESTFSNEEFINQNTPEQKTCLDVLPMLFSKVNSTFLFASVREQEENMLASVLWKIYPLKKNSLFIVAPRHMHRVQAWKRRFYDLGLRPILASEFLQDRNFYFETNGIRTFDTNYCIIWDIFGDLPFLYSQADTVFVGGSFKGLGGQNFLEALACGSIPHVGPDLDNFAWALGEDFPPSLESLGLLHRHKNKRELKDALLEVEDYKRSDRERLDVQTIFLEWIEPHCGASKLAVEKVLADRAFDNFIQQVNLLSEEIEQEENSSHEFLQEAHNTDGLVQNKTA